MRLITSKRFYKNTIAIAIPIALQNLITYGTSMMDTIMLGRADDTGTLLSASSLANQPFFLLSLICFGLSGASLVLSSQYWGKRDLKAVRLIYSIILKAAFTISFLMAAVVLIFPEWVMGLYSNNSDIIAAGAQYLRILGWAYVFFGVENTMLCSIRSVELVKISVVVNMTSFCMNVFLNWVLIFGNLGAPALGIQGAAIATLAARLSEFVITFVYLFFIDKRLRFRPKDFLLFDITMAKDLFKHGLPVLLNEMFWSLGITMQAAILGHISYSAGDPVAANSIASMIQQLSTVAIFGISNASGVVIGKSIGEKRLEDAKRQADTFIAMGIVVGAIACAFILVMKNIVVGFYTVPDETKELARQLITVIAFVTFFSSMSSVEIVGILRGGGDTRFCLWAEMLALWATAIPLAFCASTFLQWSVPVVLMCMKIDEPIKVIASLIRILKGKWIRELTRENIA